MRRVVLIVFAFCLFAGFPGVALAQKETQKEAQRPDEQREKPRFSPEEFKKKQQEFIIKHAELTAEETNSALPLLFEMKQKQREYDKQIGEVHEECEKSQYDEITCASALKKLNNLQTQKQHTEKVYQQKLLKVVSAAKLMKIMRADSQFDREMLKEMFHTFAGGEGKKSDANQRKEGTDRKKPQGDKPQGEPQPRR